MILTPSQRRWTLVNLLIVAGSLALLGILDVQSRVAWWAVCLVFLLVAWVVTALPVRGKGPPARLPAPRPDLLPRITYVVPVAFRGAPPLVFDRLLADNWKLGGHGPCVDSDGHDGFVALEVTTSSTEDARHQAGRALQRVGAQVTRIGEAIPTNRLEES